MNAWGGWELFQTLLTTLREIADRHTQNTDIETVSIANVATRWVLDQPAVGAVIVGAFSFFAPIHFNPIVSIIVGRIVDPTVLKDRWAA